MGEMLRKAYDNPPMLTQKDTNKTKKQIITAFIVATVSFVLGVYMERSARQSEVEEMVQITQEACDMRIKTIKYTCKR